MSSAAAFDAIRVGCQKARAKANWTRCWFIVDIVWCLQPRWNQPWLLRAFGVFIFNVSFSNANHFAWLFCFNQDKCVFCHFRKLKEIEYKSYRWWPVQSRTKKQAAKRTNERTNDGKRNNLVEEQHQPKCTWTGAKCGCYCFSLWMPNVWSATNSNVNVYWTHFPITDHSANVCMDCSVRSLSCIRIHNIILSNRTCTYLLFRCNFSRTESLIISSIRLCAIVCEWKRLHTHSSSCMFLLLLLLLFNWTGSMLLLKWNIDIELTPISEPQRNKREKIELNKNNAKFEREVAKPIWFLCYFVSDFVCFIVNSIPHVRFDGNCVLTACGARFGSTFPPKICRHNSLMMARCSIPMRGTRKRNSCCCCCFRSMTNAISTGWSWFDIQIQQQRKFK